MGGGIEEVEGGGSKGEKERVDYGLTKQETKQNTQSTPPHYCNNAAPTRDSQSTRQST